MDSLTLSPLILSLVSFSLSFSLSLLRTVWASKARCHTFVPVGCTSPESSKGVILFQGDKITPFDAKRRKRGTGERSGEEGIGCEGLLWEVAVVKVGIAKVACKGLQWRVIVVSCSIVGWLRRVVVVS